MGFKKFFRIKICYFRPTPDIPTFGLSIVRTQTVVINKILISKGCKICETLDYGSSI
jgi:hypothetical protein